MRFPFIDRVKKAYPLYLVCKVMQVSRSGYYSWKKRGESSRDQDRANLIPKVKAIHKASVFQNYNASSSLYVKSRNLSNTYILFSDFVNAFFSKNCN